MEKEAWDLLLDSHPLHTWQLSLPTLPPPPLLLQQDENSSHVLGDKVVGISLVDMVVANLSNPVVLTFFHDQLPVGGETVSSNLIPPGMEGQGGLRPCQLREWSQSSRSMPLACLYRVCYIFWGCITIMASSCALAVALPGPVQEVLRCRCVASSTISGAGGHFELKAPWLIHGPVRPCSAQS